LHLYGCQKGSVSSRERKLQSLKVKRPEQNLSPRTMELDFKCNILNSQKLSDLDREGSLVIVRIANLKRFKGLDIQIE
jgi:hypothetical protein